MTYSTSPPAAQAPACKIGAAYVRVSTDDQLEYSPDSQLKVIRDYAKREGYIIPEEYVFREDDGISGKSASKRPAFRMMVATAKEGKTPPFDAIFVWKYSRFARNQEEAIMYKNLLAKRGVNVRSISEPSSDSPFASLIERIIEWMDEYYLINLASEVRRGMTEKVSRGEPAGRAPFGYDVKDKKYVPNADAPFVQDIFELYDRGVGMRAIAQDLAIRGARTRHGNKPDNRFVKYVLQNPAYIGKLRWSSEGKAHYSRENFDASHTILVDADHEPIIDRALWDRVQEKLLEKDVEPKNVRKQNPRHYMLKGLVRCSVCGGTLTMTSTAVPGLQCHNYSRGQCPTSHYIKMEYAEAAVLDYLESAIRDDRFKFTPRPYRETHPARDYAKLIATEEKRLQRARDAFLDGLFTPEEYSAVKMSVDAAVAQLRTAQAEDAAAIMQQDPKQYAPKVAHVLEILRSPVLPPEEKNKALRSIIDKIIFHRPSSTMDIYFSL